MTSNIAVIIGRFQILQRGHGTLLQAALAIAPKVLIVIGSAFRARDAHNPFTWEERKQQFEAVLTPEQRQRVPLRSRRRRVPRCPGQRRCEACEMDSARAVAVAGVAAVRGSRVHPGSLRRALSPL